MAWRLGLERTLPARTGERVRGYGLREESEA
jgi:hypothetical protein